jgi:tripartite-type tricarboxylate transporter receptor subunit TctC
MSRFLLSALIPAAVLAVTSIGVASAETNFPAKPVKIITQLPVGTGPDVIVRLIGQQLTGLWGQQVVVENRPGGSGIIAAQAVAAAAPDGYTLLGAAASIYTILPAEKDKLPFDVNRDFIQVGLIQYGPLYIAVPPRLGVTSLSGLISLAKSRPHEIVVGTGGTGTLSYFGALALAKAGNIPTIVAPYATGGTAAAITDILGGRAHATIEQLAGLLGAVQSGDLKLIAVTSPERDPLIPDLPTISETLQGFSAVGWMSLAAPAGTPDHIVQRLNRGLRLALETPSVTQRFDELGVRAKIMTPAETKAYVENEEKLWWPMVREFEPK